MDVSENVFLAAWAWIANKAIRRRPASPKELRLASNLADAEIAIGRLMVELSETKTQSGLERARNEKELAIVRTDLDLKEREIENLCSVIERDRLRVQAEIARFAHEIATNTPRAAS